MKIHLLSFLLALFISSCGVSSLEPEHKLYEVSTNEKKSESADEIIKPYRDQLKDTMNYVLSKTDVDFTKGKPNGNLNNLIADIVMKAGMRRSKIHSISWQNSMCLLNWGGLRAPINKGAITVRTCFEVMPFENEIVIVKMWKEDIQKMTDYLIETGGHPVSNYQLKKGVAWIAKQELNDQQYFVITSDYLYNGGDNMTFFKGKEVIRTGYKIRDALIDYFNGKELIEDLPELRIEIDG